MTEFIYEMFKDSVWIAVIIMAAIPIIELKGAIFFACAKGFNIYQAFLFSYIGSIIPAFFILLLLKPVFNWMKKFKFSRKIAIFFEERFKKLSQKINKKVKDEQSAQNPETLAAESLVQNTEMVAAESLENLQPVQRLTEEQALLEQAKKRKTDRIKFWGVLIFVAIPLPGTGVWTGSAISVFLNMKFRRALPAVLIGNFIAGVLVSLVSMVFHSYWIIFYIILGIFLLFVLVSLVVFLVKRSRKKVN